MARFGHGGAGPTLVSFPVQHEVYLGSVLNATLTETNDTVTGAAAVLVQPSATLTETNDTVTGAPTAQLSQSLGGGSGIGARYDRRELERAVSEYLDEIRKRRRKIERLEGAERRAKQPSKIAYIQARISKQEAALAKAEAILANDDDEAIMMLLAA